jgi:hypothetical protein
MMGFYTVVTPPVPPGVGRPFAILPRYPDEREA